MCKSAKQNKRGTLVNTGRTTLKLNTYRCTDWSITCCLTVLVSQSSSCPDTWMGSRGAASELPERLRAAAEQTNDEPLGLQARDKILGCTGGTQHESLNFQNKYMNCYVKNIVYSSLLIILFNVIIGYITKYLPN